MAWGPLGWRAVAFSEIEPFPCEVLRHRFPGVPNWGDLTGYGGWPDAAVDLVVGGTPCQSFSVAGLREGLRDPRGNLALVYLGVVERYRPEWVVWENVPGVLSSNGGRDFGAFLGALAQLGYGFAWRVLDAQYVRTCRFRGAVPQRRRRVFLVGCAGGWQRAAAVLLDPESLRGNSPPRREAGQGAAGAIGGGPDGGRVAGNVTAKWAKGSGGPAGDEAYNLVAFDSKGSEATADISGAAPTLRAMGHAASHANGGGQLAVAFDVQTFVKATSPHSADEAPRFSATDVAACLTPWDERHSPPKHMVASRWTVRRLTPLECERLQGFPDGWTAVPWRGRAEVPEGVRYRALGNAMAVNCMEWLGRRIDLVRGLG